MATAFCVTLNKRSQSVKRGWKEEKNMVKLYDKGVYLLNGTEIAEDARQVEQKTGQNISREEVHDLVDEIYDYYTGGRGV